MSKIYIVDFESVFYNGQMSPKEIAIIDIQYPLELKQLLIKSRCMSNVLSCADKKLNYFVFKHLNGLTYNSGIHELKDLTKLFVSYSLIYVNGLQKTRTLQRLLPYCFVINMNTVRLSTITSYYRHVKCDYIHSHMHCAVQKLYKLYQLYCDNH
jgi:hypothetical protein